MFLSLQNEFEGAQLITREYALYCQGRFVAQAMGEHTFYSKSNLSYGKASESAKSNALMRCCKDLGVASDLWDPQVSESEGGAVTRLMVVIVIAQGTAL